MEKIIFEDLPSTKTPLNAENLNKIQDNIENAINKINNEIISINNKSVFSTEEQIIGTWFGKPLYRKNLSKTITSSTNADLGSINDVDYINVVDGCTKFVSGSNAYYVPTSTYEASNNYSKFFKRRRNCWLEWYGI